MISNTKLAISIADTNPLTTHYDLMPKTADTYDSFSENPELSLYTLVRDHKEQETLKPKTTKKFKQIFKRKNPLKLKKKENKKKISSTLPKYHCETRISEIHGFLKPLEIRKLLKETNYSRKELFIMHVRFKALCAMSPTPYGIDRETFKKGVARLSVEDDLFVNKVYDLIDEDKSDSIEWDEFLTVMSALEKGNASKQNKKSQIQFFFRIYDLDNDGVISREDLSKMFLSSSMLPNIDDTTLELTDAFVRKVFSVVTGNEQCKHLTEDDVFNYLNGEGSNEDVWDLFGRSMLKDFTDKID